MRRFYDPDISETITEHVLSEEESGHVVRVLRMNTGDALEILDGRGNCYVANIRDAHHKRCLVEITHRFSETQPERRIHIAMGPTKQGDRLEWFVEKATEIGLTHLSFIETCNMERTRLKLDRLQKKAISAMKQSRRLYLPEIELLQSYSDFLNQHPQGYIAHCYDKKKMTLQETYGLTEGPILIGPEGDFTPSEVEQAIASGYYPVTLGENRLRTETAALYAVVCASM